MLIGRMLKGPFKWGIETPLLTSNQVPNWLVDNQFILGWCRPVSLSAGQCLLSVVQLHNQTLNIWTHLVGLGISQYLLWFRFPSHLSSWTDNFVMMVALMGINISFMCSVIYHVFNNSTYRVSRFLSQVDYFGIILHLIGCMLALVYFAYYHHRTLQLCYIGLFSLVGVACLVMNYYCLFSSVANRMSSVQRSAFFVFVALLSLPPQLKVGYEFSWSMAKQACQTDLLYIIAALVYSSKWPERWYPGYFDLFHSHTIFHIVIVAAGCSSISSFSLLSYEAVTKEVN